MAIFETTVILPRNVNISAAIVVDDKYVVVDPKDIEGVSVKQDDKGKITIKVEGLLVSKMFGDHRLSLFKTKSNEIVSFSIKISTLIPIDAFDCLT